MLFIRRDGLNRLLPTLKIAGRTVDRLFTISSTSDGATSMPPSPPPRLQSAHLENMPAKFDPKKVLVLTKITRYEFEKQKYPNLTDEELDEVLAKKGSNFKRLKELNDFHKNQARKIVQSFSERNIEARMVNRYEYGPEVIDWADAIFTAGGDGTFLLGASKLHNVLKPMIGINTDPRRSEGYLCLPKENSADFSTALDKLLNGKFKWFYRQRIRIDLSGPSSMDSPVELHEQQLEFPEHRFSDYPQEDDSGGQKGDAATSEDVAADDSESLSRTLPEFALNEVFIGESLSSRVSYYEIIVDDIPAAKQKSSGVTICTGTGSTSWSFNINKLTQQATSSLIRIIRDTSLLPVPSDDSYAELVTDRFNSELLFDPSDTRMVYTVRDPVSNTTYSAANPRGFAQRVQIKSRCYDAALVIDGGPSYRFNEGAQAIFTIHPDDALLTVQLD